MANKTLKPIFRYFSYILLLSIAPGCDYFNKTVTTAEKNTEKKEAVSAPEAQSDGSRVL